MKIGVITSHFVPNYGAALQAYALCRILKDMQNEVEIIDYRPQAISSKHRIVGAGPEGPTRGIVRALCRYSIAAPRLFVERKQKSAAIRRFARQYMSTTEVTYSDDASFDENPLHFDAYICGSDQIWNPNLHGFLPAYFLHFVPAGRGRLISYAPSFGELSTQSEHSQEIASLLMRFDHLSVRERAGQRFISELIGRTAEHVLDPVLLLEDYSSVTADPKQEGDFVAVYAVEPSPAMLATIRTIKKHLDIPVISLGGPLAGADEYKGAIGPQEWLGYLNRSRFICTNSYHGTIMAIQFRKQFLSIPRGTDNVRIGDLLERLGLRHRQIGGPEDADIGARLQEPVRHDQVAETLGKLRRDSLDYLRRALTG